MKSLLTLALSALSALAADHLPSWNDTAPKKANVAFVEKVTTEGSDNFVRIPELNFIDDKEGKPVGIQSHIGRRPIASFGNSDGDLQMHQWTQAGDGLRFRLYVHHTDAEREWAYDRDSHIGRLDKGLDEAKENGWTVVDMKNDWKSIFPNGTN